MAGVADAQPGPGPSPFVSLRLTDTCSQPLSGFQVDNLGLLSTLADVRGIAEVDQGGQAEMVFSFAQSPVGCEYLDTIDAPQVCVALAAAADAARGESCLRAREPVNVVVTKSDWSRRTLDLVWKRFGSLAGALRLPPCGCRSVESGNAPTDTSWSLVPASFQSPEAASGETAARSYEEGAELVRQLRFADAVTLFEDAWSTDPQARYGLALGIALTEAGDLDQAEAILTEALGVVEQAGDSDEQSLTWAVAFHEAMAHLSLSRQDWQGALENAAAANDPALRAEALLGQGEVSEALDWSMRAVEADVALPGASACEADSEPSRNVTRDLELIGRIFEAQGDQEQALEYMRRARRMDRCTHPDGPVLGETSIGLARLLLETGGRDNLVEARAAAEEGVETLENYFGPNHTRVAEAKAVLASVALAMGGSLSVALDSARTALRIDQQAYSPNDAPVIRDEDLVQRAESRRRSRVRTRNLTIVGAAVAGAVIGTVVGLTGGSPTPRIEAGPPSPP